mmetsp:Transcript_22933/g.38568  ORF Transcript_22933/g.38568 Transcript_22933/m.38568 type:complete len:273 (+) Transcript_22933:2402-3220(+)
MMSSGPDRQPQNSRCRNHKVGHRAKKSLCPGVKKPRAQHIRAHIDRHHKQTHHHRQWIQQPHEGKDRQHHQVNTQQVQQEIGADHRDRLGTRHIKHDHRRPGDPRNAAQKAAQTTDAKHGAPPHLPRIAPAGNQQRQKHQDNDGHGPTKDRRLHQRQRPQAQRQPHGRPRQQAQRITALPDSPGIAQVGQRPPKLHNGQKHQRRKRVQHRRRRRHDDHGRAKAGKAAHQPRCNDRKGQPPQPRQRQGGGDQIRHLCWHIGCRRCCPACPSSA